MPWSAQIHTKFHVHRVTQEIPRACFGFRLRASHPLWSDFPFASPNRRTTLYRAPTTPMVNHGFGLFRFRSPLLTESLSLSFPRVTEMFHFARSRDMSPMNSDSFGRTLLRPGYPIRKSTGHRVFASHRSLSQLITSFFAYWHQGIHYVLLVA